MGAIHQLFGLFGDKYYMVPDCNHVVIPENVDYTSKSVQVKLNDTYPQAEIDMFHYHTDLTTTCNVARVANMKEMILSEKITEIESTNENYVLGIEFELYNKDGKLLKSGTSETEAQYCAALVTDEIMEGNVMEYRKGLVFDGRIEITIPEISRYGIRNAYEQCPFILKVNGIYLLTSKGDGVIITEKGSQVNSFTDCVTDHVHHAYSSNYRCHMHDTLCDRNFASCFLTNAKVGTTMIDATVMPTKLDIPERAERIKMCSISCTGSDYTLKLNKKLNLIILNLEVFLDNFNNVYDVEDIRELLSYNASSVDDEIGGEEQTYDPDDLTPITNNTDNEDNTNNTSDTPVEDLDDGKVDDLDWNYDDEF